MKIALAFPVQVICQQLYSLAMYSRQGFIYLMTLNSMRIFVIINSSRIFVMINSSRIFVLINSSRIFVMFISYGIQFNFSSILFRYLYCRQQLPVLIVDTKTPALLLTILSSLRRRNLQQDAFREPQRLTSRMGTSLTLTSA